MESMTPISIGHRFKSDRDSIHVKRINLIRNELKTVLTIY